MILAAMAFMAVTLSSCSNDEPENPAPGPSTPQGDEMAVSGVWKSGTEIRLDRHLVIPEGESLTIEPGVKVVVSTDGVGINHAPVEIIVKGNLYCMGSEDAPVWFTVDDDKQTVDNTFKGLWGGIVAMPTCGEMVIDHAVIEYCGGQVIEGSPAATAGIYTAGDDAYPQITTTNINGRYVISNSVIRNGWSDGVYLMGGNAIISGNTFAANGYDGAEAVNIKAGVKADIAGNVMFSPNTNGLKLSSSGQSETRGQAVAYAYNNTIVNAGWRRDGEKGGCVYVEKNCLATVVNNLMVNCKFRAMTPSYGNPNSPDGGFDDKSVIDYNFYASGSRRSPVVFPDESNVAYSWEGYNYNHKSYNPATDIHSKIASEGNLLDPMFVDFDINGVALTDYVMPAAYDFHLKPSSPALSGAMAAGSIRPTFAAGLVINGVTYSSPALQPHFGAFAAR